MCLKTHPLYSIKRGRVYKCYYNLYDVYSCISRKHKIYNISFVANKITIFPQFSLLNWQYCVYKMCFCISSNLLHWVLVSSSILKLILWVASSFYKNLRLVKRSSLFLVNWIINRYGLPNYFFLQAWVKFLTFCDTFDWQQFSIIRFSINEFSCHVVIFLCKWDPI